MGCRCIHPEASILYTDDRAKFVSPFLFLESSVAIKIKNTMFGKNNIMTHYNIFIDCGRCSIGNGTYSRRGFSIFLSERGGGVKKFRVNLF